MAFENPSADCCNNDCPCPGDKQVGAYWEKNYRGDCCGCKVYYVSCDELTSGAEPHEVKPTEDQIANDIAVCDCECDPDRLSPCPDEKPDLCTTGGRCECCCQLSEDNPDSDPCSDSGGGLSGSGKSPYYLDRNQCRCRCDPSFDCASANPATPHLNKYEVEEDGELVEVCECICSYAEGNPATCAEATEGKQPDLNDDDCTCFCALERQAELGNDPCTDPAAPDILPDKCECGCILADNAISCSDGDQNLEFDPATCSCKCFLTAEDCSGSTPDFDPDKCSCYCIHQTEGNECPPEKPSLNQNCECVCPLVDSDCSSGQSVDDTTCQCKCTNDSSSCTQAEPDFDDILCECYCALAEQQASHEAANGRPSSPACDDGYVVDGATCSCVEAYDAGALDIDLLP
jgi:hypothetical protein